MKHVYNYIYYLCLTVNNLHDVFICVLFTLYDINLILVKDNIGNDAGLWMCK